MPTVSLLSCAACATFSALDCDVADSMMIVQPSPPGHAGKLPVVVPVLPVFVLGSGEAVAEGVGVGVAFGSVVALGPGRVVVGALGSTVAPGSAEGVGVSEATGVGVVVATTDGAGVGVGVSWA